LTKKGRKKKREEKDTPSNPQPSILLEFLKRKKKNKFTKKGREHIKV